MDLSWLPPGSFMIGLATLLVLVPARYRRARCLAIVAIPVVSMLHLAFAIPEGTLRSLDWMNVPLTLVRADRVAMIWGWVFHLATLLAAIYSLYDRTVASISFALIYAGSAIAAVFAGDLLTLFVWWELTAVASAFLVWAGGRSQSAAAGTRYLILQVTSGVLLLAGTLGVLAAADGAVDCLAFGGLGQLGVFVDNVDQWPIRLVLIAFGIKAAFPLLHSWLPDAYPEASPMGTVFLSTFTTKMAIYALLRGFAGWQPLIAIGCVMAIAPLVYAILEDDLRRCLAYCLINQLGFMVVAIGVGTQLAVDGVAAHAIAHILYKGLLLMVAGAILETVGTARISTLGGLATAMPRTFAVYLVGVAAIALPLFSGFVTKSLSLAAVAESHHQLAWLCLMVATAGVFWVCGPRIIYQVFLRTPRGRQPQQTSDANRNAIQDAPASMMTAMFLAAVCCLLVGLFPVVLYRWLPNSSHYRPYTFAHVVSQLQLLSATAFVFVVLQALHWIPSSDGRKVPDLDRFWGGPVRRLAVSLSVGWGWMTNRFGEVRARTLDAVPQHLSRFLSEDGDRGQIASTGQMAMYAALMLILYLLVYFR